jgi:hypothetical protein
MALLGWIPSGKIINKKDDIMKNKEKKETIVGNYVRDKMADFSNNVNARIQRNPQKAKKYFLFIFCALFIFLTTILVIRIIAVNISIKNINTEELSDTFNKDKQTLEQNNNTKKQK